MARLDEIGETMKYEWEVDLYNQEVWELMTRIDENPEGSLRCLKQYAEKGSALAAICLGDILFFGLHGVSQDKSDAIYWARLAAQKGSIEGGFQLAEYLEEAKDFRESEKEYTKLANRGYAPAMYRLARKYWSGREFPKDKEMSHMYFLRAIKSGHLPAKADLAKLKRSGEFGLRERIEGILEFFYLILRMAIMLNRNPNADSLRR